MAFASLCLIGNARGASIEFFSFPGGSYGSNPAYAGVVLDNQGFLYGTTAAGGIGGGIVFRLKPPASPRTSWAETA